MLVYRQYGSSAIASNEGLLRNRLAPAPTNAESAAACSSFCSCFRRLTADAAGVCRDMRGGVLLGYTSNEENCFFYKNFVPEEAKKFANTIYLFEVL